MGKRKSKQVVIRVGGKAWTCERAELHLSDEISSGRFNHPQIRILCMRTDSDRRHELILWLKFQRDERMGDNAADGFMDTCRGWSHAYAGHVELRSADRFSIADQPFRLCEEDAVAVDLARILARTISEYNLTYVTLDECAQTVGALEKLGVSVEKLYHVAGAGEPVSLYQVENRHANSQARAERLRAAEQEDPSCESTS